MSVTWNPNDKYSGITLSNSNLTAFGSLGVRATEGKPSGKWYWEVKLNTGTGTAMQFTGVSNLNHAVASDVIGTGTNGIGYYCGSGLIRYNSVYAVSGLTTCALGNIVGIALDADNNTISWYKNGTLVHTSSLISGVAKPWYAHHSFADPNCSCTANFGDSAFAYSVPSGFIAYGLSKIYTASPQTIILPSINTVGRGGINSIAVIDSTAETVNIDVYENMVDGGILGSGKLWTKPVNKHAVGIEVV